MGGCYCNELKQQCLHAKGLNTALRTVGISMFVFEVVMKDTYGNPLAQDTSGILNVLGALLLTHAATSPLCLS